MNETLLLAPILLPIIAGAAVLLFRKEGGVARQAITLLAAAANVVVCVALFIAQRQHPVEFSFDFATFGTAKFLLTPFSAFILLAISGFGVLVSLYCWSFMKDRKHANQFFCYMLLSIGLSNGAVLADHLVLMLFFWEGLLGPLFGIVAIGRPGAWKTATKALIIVGVTDLAMMVGIALAGVQAGSLSMAAIAASPLQLTAMGGLAFVLMMIGAISKAGSMPFHSWIPDAAVDAPLPFMAILPASLEKLLGIYLLGRICLDLFAMQKHVGSWVSCLLMIVGSLTILLAVMMALIQKDYKRLLSYHAISQVGYMVLGVGTCVPIGIVGGIFHMINHAMYKSCLFLTGGSVEKQAGTTDLAKLGGLASKMPITFACFFVAAASISGCPPFNGFFSKELIYDAANQQSPIFYIAALLGTFFTAASFLKLGHAAYFGKLSEEHAEVKEAPASMLLPMLVIAAGCVLFGVCNFLPLQGLVEPAVGTNVMAMAAEEGRKTFSGWHIDPFLACMTMVALLGAVLNHMMGARMGGSGLHAVDHIQNAPVLATIYDRAGRRWFDPYDLGLKMTAGVARFGYWIDRGIDWLYNGLAVGAAEVVTRGIRAAHTGNYSMYVIWALAGAALVMLAMM